MFQFPTARLKERIAQLCYESGIIFIETEESYTSLASKIDGEYLPNWLEKPDDGKPSGKRIKRGLYKSGNNCFVNAPLQWSCKYYEKSKHQS